VQVDDFLMQRMVDCSHVAEGLAFAGHSFAEQREIVEAKHDVLRRHNDRLSVRWMQDVVRRHHEHARFQLRLKRQRDVHGHLVAVKVRVERCADQRVQLDRLAFDQHRLKGLNAKTVQGRSAIEQHRVLADHLVEDVPNFRLLLLDQLLGLLDRRGQTLGIEPRVDERLEQLERHFLWRATLVQLEFGADHDHRAAGIVDALAEQVLPETALLALEHVSQRLQRALVGARDNATTSTIVEQRIDRFLQHAFFVADNDVRRAELDQPLQSVVAVDDAAIEIVEIGRGKTSTVERHQRPQIGRDHRYDRQDHPFWLVAGIDEGLDQLEALGDLLLLDVAVGLREFGAQFGLHLLKVDTLEHLADRFRTNRRCEAVGAVFLLRLEVFVLGQELTVLERGEPWLEHHVVFEVQDPLEILERHVEQKTNAARQRLQEPNVRNGGGKLDVAHPLAPHTRQRHLNGALLADDALVLHALVLAAQAFVIL